MAVQRTRSTEPLSRETFEARLSDWYQHTNEEQIGDSGSYGGSPWLWVRYRANLFHLNADTKRAGVGEYLRMLRADPALSWTVVEGRAGKMTKVVLGRVRTSIPGFYLYAKDAGLSASDTARMDHLEVDRPLPSASVGPRPGFESLLIGRTLDGRYQIDAVLGRGGMGAVYRATDQRLGRAVAVKVMMTANVDPDAHERLRHRFRREARVAAGIHHPNVVAIFDFGTDEPLGLDYLVMELLDGEDLAAALKRSDRLLLSAALTILEQAARGVGAGHRAGLVHRDIKPANLFLERADAPEWMRVRVLDFGIAQILSEWDETLTHLTVAGSGPLSPSYASPEQLRGVREMSPASDVFSLAATGFQLLTGARPFDPSQVQRIAAGQPVGRPSARQLNAKVPEEVDRVLARAMRIDAAERYQDASHFADAIAGAAEAVRGRANSLSEKIPTQPESSRGESTLPRQVSSPLAHSRPSSGADARVPEQGKDEGGLHRRRIRASLMEHGWSVESHVDGTIDVQVSGQQVSTAKLKSEIDAQVRTLGYTPTFVPGADQPGTPCIRFHTPETLAQAGRGAHGYASPVEEKAMLEWLGVEGDRLQRAFKQVFGERCRPFGKRSTWIGGLSDGNKGVQWNAGYDPRDGRRWVGVNLEGMQYDGWPVSRLIQRELRVPSLPSLTSQLEDRDHIEVLWARDYWQASSRPLIVEREISPTPIRLSRLTEALWREALLGARECLDESRGYRGRATQSVTLASGHRRVEGPVSPHLTFTHSATESSPWDSFLRLAKDSMQVLYEWTIQHSAPE